MKEPTKDEVINALCELMDASAEWFTAGKYTTMKMKTRIEKATKKAWDICQYFKVRSDEGNGTL